MPHITEELWQGLGYDAQIAFIQNAKLTGADQLAAALTTDPTAIERVTQLQEFISQGRGLKAQYNLANKRDVAVFYSAEGAAAAVLSNNLGLIQALAGFGSCQPLGQQSGDGLPAVVTPLGSLYLDLSSSIDVVAERTRLTKELQKLNKLVAAGEGKLKNAKFVASAPEQVVAGARKQLVETTERRDETQRILNSIVG